MKEERREKNKMYRNEKVEKNEKFENKRDIVRERIIKIGIRI